MRIPYIHIASFLMALLSLGGLPIASGQSTQYAVFDVPKISSTGFPTVPTLQQMLDQPVAVIHIPYGEYVLDKPVYLRSNTTVRFASGTRVLAAPGAFKGIEDAMIMLTGVSNVVIEAHGCTFKMRKQDYLDTSQYKRSEWRHVLSIRGCTNISIFGGRYESSGGDGIYIGPLWYGAQRTPCDAIAIMGVTCHDNLRQGISVLATKNSIIADSIFSATAGASPQSGIDIEPEHGDSVDIVVRNCISKGNRGAAYMVNLVHVKPERYIRISFENCKSVGVPPDQLEFKTIEVFDERGRLADHLPIGAYLAWNGLVWIKRY